MGQLITSLGSTNTSLSCRHLNLLETDLHLARGKPYTDVSRIAQKFLYMKPSVPYSHLTDAGEAEVMSDVTIRILFFWEMVVRRIKIPVIRKSPEVKLFVTLGQGP